MIACAIDHVVIRTLDPDAMLARLSELTGLPVLRGWTPVGEIESRGVRFANGPFLDVFGETRPPPIALGLSGPVGDLEAEAVRRGWRVKANFGRVPVPPYEPEPWSILLFRKGQGALSAMFVIDYLADHPSWKTVEYSGELFRPSQSGARGPRLTRVWIAADASKDGELTALGLTPGGLLEGGRLFRGAPADVVLVDPVGPEAAVVRLDLEGGPVPCDV